MTAPPENAGPVDSGPDEAHPDGACAECAALLGPYLDGELDALTARRVEAQCATCPECAADLRALAALSNDIARHYQRPLPPAALVRRLRAALMSGRVDAPILRWGGPIAGGALAATLLLSFGLAANGPDIAREAAAGHVRSLMAAHLIDIVSASHHQVKPWFAGRLDFTPPVPDLSAQGFVLAGGRLDYLAGRPVAALVYRREAHVINLFIWPARGVARTPDRTVRAGFNLRHWAGQGMNFEAVSDLNPGDLARFALAFRAGADAAEPPP